MEWFCRTEDNLCHWWQENFWYYRWRCEAQCANQNNKIFYSCSGWVKVPSNDPDPCCYWRQGVTLPDCTSIYPNAERCPAYNAQP